MVFHNLKFFKPAGILCVAVLLILIIATSDHYKDTGNYSELKEAADEYQLTNEVPNHESGKAIVTRTLFMINVLKNIFNQRCRKYCLNF